MAAGVAWKDLLMASSRGYLGKLSRGALLLVEGDTKILSWDQGRSQSLVLVALENGYSLLKWSQVLRLFRVLWDCFG
jgi:hypothetical protein